MFKLLKNTQCYDPEYKGKRDILIVLDKIAAVEENIDYENLPGTDVYDCTGKIACPGFIDQHLHILGGGGEEGPASSISEISPEDILTAGVSTVVGVLGLDSIGKTIQGLLAKARTLETKGPNTYIYTGYYGLPPVTLTGRVITDIACIDKVIGVGEIAISDYRSSHPTLQTLKELSFEVMTGGMLGGKAGVLHIHVGNGKMGLQPLMELVEDSDFPIGMFVPTHLNRSRKLFGQALEYVERGGNVDLTAGENSEQGLSVPCALDELLKNGADMNKVTISSDGNGSISGAGNIRVGRISMLLDDVRASILEKKLPVELVLKTVTSNVAGVLKLYPSKGALKAWSDGDILILNQKDYSVDKLFIKGNLVVDNGVQVKM